MEANFNPLITNLLNVAYWQNQVVAKIILPSNSLPVDYTAIATYALTNVEYTQRVRISPVPSAIVAQLTNTILENSVNYTKAFYPVSDDNTISVYNSLFTTLVNITLENGNGLT
jgi:hypothetical protein